jgi:MoaA/NifB/PqqE/SkfB family radical SAM enzyme
VTQGNRGFCAQCRAIVPARHVVRDRRVFLRKECPDCGATESLLSSDVTAWQRKRDIWRYQPPEQTPCTLQCHRCGIDHDPTIVFVDVTNRCNMNCPICIANVRGMGFEFHPPLAYFEKIYEALGRLETKPTVELFGGEPTLRDDLLEIIAIGRRHGVKSRVVTNGLKLADEDYCKRLCEAGVRFRLALDGRHPDIYRRLRRAPAAYEKKLKALANLKRFSRRKNALLCCAARGINDAYIGDLIECCHENQGVIDSLGLLPLAETWDPDTFETDLQTSREDVEQMVMASVPGGKVEFVPVGLMHALRRARSFFKKRSSSDALMFGGVHPDCETMTMLVSDGKRYRSINHFLRQPLSRVVQEVVDRARRVDQRLSRLDPGRRSDRVRGQVLLIRTFAPLALKAIDLRRVFRGNPLAVMGRLLFGLARGKRAGDLARRHLNLSQILRVAVLPFEEFHSIDAMRMAGCKAVFAYEDVADGRVKTVPACSWGSVYRNDILRKITAKYGTVPRQGDASVLEHARPESAPVSVTAR